MVASYGFNRTTIYRWLSAAATPGVGLRALRWDESGFRADSVHGKTWGKKGQTPVVERPGQLRRGEKLQAKIEAQLSAIKRMPRLIRSFFKAPSVAYITDW